MSGPVAFYAPLKPPDHPVPSGDRRMARAMIEALRLAGIPVEVASRLRSYDRTGDPVRQRHIRGLGDRVAAQLLQRYRRMPAARRPRAWLTYHAYHKSPDWLGPTITAALGIPYLLAEASFAPKQREGAWADGHAATEQAIRAADLVLALTEVDAECLAPLVVAAGRAAPAAAVPRCGAVSRGARRAAAPPRGARPALRPGPAAAMAACRGDDARRRQARILRAFWPTPRRSWAPCRGSCWWSATARRDPRSRRCCEPWVRIGSGSPA